MFLITSKTLKSVKSDDIVTGKKAALVIKVDLMVMLEDR
jgi:hypothetical protein